MVMTIKGGRQGLAYGFWLNKVFAYFNVEHRKGKDGSIKHIFNITTLEYNECIPKREGRKFKCIVSELIDV